MSKPPIMHLQTSFPVAATRFIRRRVDYSSITVRSEETDEDSRESVRAEDLDDEWIAALKSADYSHLPRLKKQLA